MSRLKFGVWNAKNGGYGLLHGFASDCKREGAIAIGFIEVWRRHGELNRIAEGMGWKIVAQNPGQRETQRVNERGDAVLLVHPEFLIVRVQFLELDEPWLVKDFNNWHTPRIIIRVVGWWKGQRVELLLDHGPTKSNKQAVAEFKNRLAGLMIHSIRGTLTVSIGDKNFRRVEAKRWARKFGAKVAGWGPDLVVAILQPKQKGEPLRWVKVKSKRMGKRKSDHYAMMHTVITK